jgi:hypothetical protein
MWWQNYKSRISTLRSMDSPEVEFTFSDTDMTMVSSLASTTVPWKGFTEVWERPQFWMLFLPGNQYVLVPVDTWSPEIKEFVRSMLRQGNVGAGFRKELSGYTGPVHRR